LSDQEQIKRLRLTAFYGIQDVVEERDTARRLLAAATQMQTETQAKLAKAMAGLRKIADHKHFSWDQGWMQNAEARIASATLAELEGG
jgi:hypothetical protein